MTKNVLVSGGNGFLASHIIFQLLNQGYFVHTSVRNDTSAEALKQTLIEQHAKNMDKLTIFFADLLNDAGWPGAFAGCDYFLSVASPVFFDHKNLDKQINISREGTLRLLKFAKQAQIKHTVMTSNYGAIGFSSFDKSHIITEQDWTNTNQPGLSAYEKSKTLAEQAAWQYAQNEALNLTTINPVAMFGPSLNQHVSGSFNVLKQIVSGNLKLLPKIKLNVVDVRDVAKMHILAMESTNAINQRFIASAPGSISFQEIAALIKQERPDLSAHISTLTLPTTLLKLTSHFNQDAREGLLLAQLNRHIDTTKASNYFNYHSDRTNADIILDSLNSLVLNMNQ